MVLGAPGPIRSAENVEFEYLPGKLLRIQQTRNLGSATGWLVWPVSAHLCQYVLMNANVFRQKRILELGSGTGLVGLICNIVEVSNVVMTDMEECLPICQANYILNSDSLNPNCNLCVEPLLWGDRDRCTDILQKHGPFDFLIGADIVYHQAGEVLSALVESIIALSGSNTVFILAYEYRECMIEDEVTFFAPLRLRFRSVEQIDISPDRWIYIFRDFIE